MKEGKQYFLLGCLMALGAGLFLLDPGTLQAVSRQVSLGLQTREVRLTVDLGLYNPDFLGKDFLDAPVSRREFARLLRGFLHMVGAPAGYSQGKLEESGIFTARPPKQALSRKLAGEAVCRALLHLADVGLLTVEGEGPTRFPDYAPPPKYQAAIAYLRRQKVIRGYPDGSFQAARAITTREAISLLYRFYETAAATIGETQARDTAHFVDLPLDHPMVAKLHSLQEAGAFTHVHRGPSFDGNATISLADLQSLFRGLFDKRSLPPPAADLQALLGRQSAANPARRRHLVLLIGHLASAGSSQSSPTLERPYADVPPGAPEIPGLAALEQVGISLGYADRRLAGDEPLSWFETVGILHAWLERTSTGGSPATAVEEAATRTDFEEFAALIKAKKERIRGILDRKPRYSRN